MKRGSPIFAPMLILKVGGRVLEDDTARAQLVRTIAGRGRVVLVHGGGNMASELSRQLGFEPRMLEGRRITGPDDLRVATMVYAGWLNKRLVAELHAAGKTAVGLSGADGDLVRATKRPITSAGVDFGLVGDVRTVNVAFLRQLLATGLTPVVCALSHDGRGQLLNTNADTIATEIAGAFDRGDGLLEYYRCLDLPGVMRDVKDPGSVLPTLSRKQYDSMRAAGEIHAGMIPKLDTAFGLLAIGVTVRLGNVAGIEYGGTALEP